MKLTSEQLEHYNQEGYVLLGRVLSDAQLENLRAEEARFRAHRGIDNSQPGTHFFSKMVAHSPVVREILERGAHVEALPQLLSTPNVIFRHDQFVTKMPDGATNKSEFPWHQDEGYEPVDPPAGVTVWIALDDMTLENGCIWVMPQSHQAGNLPHDAKGDNDYLTLPVEGDGVPALMRAGEAIAFTGLTLHRSKHNKSSAPRRAFFVGYANAAARFHRRDEAEWRPLIGSSHSWMVCGEAPLD